MEVKMIAGHNDSLWKIMSICEIPHSNGKMVITTIGCPTINLGTLVKTITDVVGHNGVVISTSVNFYHVLSSRLKPQLVDGNIVGYILICETEPE